MARTEKTYCILNISNNPAVQKSVRSAFKNEKDFVLFDEAFKEKGLELTIASIKPDIILLDFELKGTGTYTIVDKIATDFPGISVLVILPESKVSHSDKVILAGARAFVLYPFTQKSILTACRRVVELTARNHLTAPVSSAHVAQAVKPKNTYMIFSPKGGTGVTTVAINLAIGLFQQIKEPVLLVDGKHLFGHVSLMLNLRSGNSITDLISHAGLLDAQLINQVVVNHVSGIKILPSPASISEGQGIHPDDLYKVIEALQATFPVIVIDGGNYLDENAVTYMDASDQIILVMNPNLAAIRDARQFVDVTHTLQYHQEKILVVLNNAGHKVDVQQKEIEEILKMKVSGMIPGDENAVNSAINEGIPLIIKNPRHPTSKAVMKLAQLIRERINLANSSYQMAEKKASADVLTKTSRLG